MENIAYGILDVSQFCCLLLGSDQTVVYANKRAKETFGEGLAGLSIDHISPENQSSGQSSRDAMRAHLNMADMLGSKRFAWEACSLDGQLLPHPFEVDCATLEVDGQACTVMYFNVLGHNCVGCENLKERKDTEERIKTIMEHMPMVALTFDSDFNILDCNQAAVDMLGMKDKQHILENFAQNVPEFQPDGTPSQAKAKHLINRALEEGVIVFEWMSIRSDGEPVPAEVTLVRVESKGEYNVMAFQLDLRELYKYKETEYSLKQRSGAMLDSSPLACSIFDENNNIVETNRKAEDLFEIPDKQIYIDNFYDFSPRFQPDGMSSPEKAAQMLETTRENGSANFVWLHQTRDGKPIPTEVYLKKVVLEGKNHVISYARDLR